MQESLYQTADAGDTISASVCRSLSIRQRMQETLYQTADAEVSLLDSGCRSLSIRQRMQEKLYQTADAEVFLSDSGCRRHSIRCSHCLIECLLHQLSDRETSASAVLIERLLHLLLRSDRETPALSDRETSASTPASDERASV